MTARCQWLAAALVALAGCASEPEPVDLRAPAAAAPTPRDWQAAAAGVASEVADILDRREAALLTTADRPVSLVPILGNAPADLYDMLMHELVLAGVPVAGGGGSPMVLHCAVAPATGTDRPRGALSVGPSPMGETAILCLLSLRDRYIAAARRNLHPSQSGIVLEVTG